MGWVKSHIGVHGNEIADEMAKKRAQERAETLQVTEGGIRQKIKKWRIDVRQVEGFGKGKVMSWSRRTATSYSQLRTNKGALQAWRYKIGKAESPECRHCRKAAETGITRFLFAKSGGSCGERFGWRRKPRRGGGVIGKISTVETG